MATVPLPDVPCLRVRLVYTGPGALMSGTRFYLSYTGSAPTGANCSTLATDIEGVYSTYMTDLMDDDIALTEIDVLDIATDSGLSGQWSGSSPGLDSGPSMPQQCAINVEYGIARRYRGGKPRTFLPPPATGHTLTPSQWDPAFVASVNADIGPFFAGVQALDVGALGTLKHVNLSYYNGYQNIVIPGKRARSAPTYRATALHDDITGYFCKQEIGSQRRRRTSTTP